MTDTSPTGESFSISDRASSSARLEGAYRRLVACYPRSFRRENTEEIIAVLLATADEEQRRPSLAEAADLFGRPPARRPFARLARTRPTRFSCAVMAIGIAAVALLLVRQSWPYYASHATAL